MPEFSSFALKGFLRASSGRLEPFSLDIDPPASTSQGLFQCNVHCSLLHDNPHPVHSRLYADAWAKAFELVHRMIRFEDKELVDDKGTPIPLPSPARDPACVKEEEQPDVAGVVPIFRVEGWTKRRGPETRRVELAIWPAFEKEHGTFCAPMRCGLRRNGQVMCSYGASPEQAVYLAFKYLQIEIEHDEISDDKGRPLDIPLSPEPPLIEGPSSS
jgi:hypothetical protein